GSAAFCNKFVPLATKMRPPVTARGKLGERTPMLQAAMDAIRTLVVDDEKPARTRLLELLERDHAIKVVGVARDGGEAIEMIRAQTPQLMFLDVQMPVLDGFGVLKETTAENRPATVFVTAYDTYAIQAFEAHALDYLLKPYSDERFETALKRVCQMIRSQ